MQEEINIRKVAILGSTCWYCGQTQSVENPRDIRALAVSADAELCSLKDITELTGIELVMVHTDEFRSAAFLMSYNLRDITEIKDRRNQEVPEIWIQDKINSLGNSKEYEELIKKAINE